MLVASFLEPVHIVQSIPLDRLLHKIRNRLHDFERLASFGRTSHETELPEMSSNIVYLTRRAIINPTIGLHLLLDSLFTSKFLHFAVSFAVISAKLSITETP
jgi:hypothetical protein